MRKLTGINNQFFFYSENNKTFQLNYESIRSRQSVRLKFQKITVLWMNILESRCGHFDFSKASFYLIYYKMLTMEKYLCVVDKYADYPSLIPFRYCLVHFVSFVNILVIQLDLWFYEDICEKNSRGFFWVDKKRADRQINYGYAWAMHLDKTRCF